MVEEQNGKKFFWTRNILYGIKKNTPK
jgi:hypothetical protein